MHRVQKIASKSKKNVVPQIIDNRTPKPEPELVIDPAMANLPLRVLFLMEVGDMEAAKVQLLVQEAGAMYKNMRGGIYYILPVRHGKLKSDLFFEKEALELINQLCEVVDGKIVLRGGATECNIIRQNI